MANFRIPITVRAALGAILTLTIAPAMVGPTAVTAALAEPQAMVSAAGAPLKLTPPQRQTKKFTQTRKFKRAARARAPLRSAQRRAAPAPRQQDDGTVMRGSDTIGLIAQLPWWRADETQIDRRREKEAESQVRSATEAWLGTPIADSEAVSDYAQAAPGDVNENDPTAETIVLADANEINEIDLATAETPAPSDKSWFHALLAVLGGAFAAASAARFFLV
jgi:hypothetical protein